MNRTELKKRIGLIIQKARRGDKPSLYFDYFIVTLIFLNVIAIVLESFVTLYYRYIEWFSLFEVISVITFTVEYLLRLWTADISYIQSKRVKSRFSFLVSPMALIDLFAILPFYLPMIIPFDLRFLRMLRIIRFLRIFKLNRYSSAFHLVGKVLRKKKNELLVTIFITMMLLLIASTLIYYMENTAQPEAFPNIIASFWWAISTLTTVGYGDVYPVTAWGRLLSGIIAFIGIGLVALPTGIISSGFMQELSEEEKREEQRKKERNIKYCPYCGKKINEV